MELLLWRWSTTAQTASLLMIAIFFIVLARSVRRAELQTWVNAWLANLLALGVTAILWVGQPRSRGAFIAMRMGYFFSKTMFVALLALGAWGFVRPRLGARANREIILAIAAYAVIGAFTLETIDLIGMVQSAIIAVVLAVTAVLLVVKRIPGSGWLAAGFTIRAVLGFIEAVAYGSRVAPATWVPGPQIGLVFPARCSPHTGARGCAASPCGLILHSPIRT